MSKCKHCHVFITDGLKNCPLCHRQTNASVKEEDRFYPDYETPKLKRIQRLSYRLWLFLSIAVCIISAFINLFTYEHSNHKLWFLYIVVMVLYLWLLIANTILSSSRKGAKMILQTIGLSLLLYIIDANSGYRRWSVNLVIPFIIVGSIVSIMTAFYSRKKMWNEYIGFAIAMSALGFIPIILYVCKVSTLLWPSAVCALCAALALTAMLVFSNKQLKKDMKRRFHY